MVSTASCVKAPTDVKEVLRTVSPDVVRYSKAQTQAVITELEQANQNAPFCTKTPQTCTLLIDYYVMREQSRGLKGN